MTINQAEIDRRFDLHTPTDQDVRAPWTASAQTSSGWPP